MAQQQTLPKIASTPSASRLDFLWLELTQKCNLACDHCYVSSGPHLPLADRMQHADWLAAISDARALGCHSLQFIGGEPLLYPRITNLIDHARACGFGFIEVYTNGTPVTPRTVEMLARSGVHVAASMYSTDPQVHDRITHRQGSFARTLAALKSLVASKVPVRIGFIEMTSNQGHFDATKAMLQRLGIDRVACDRVRDIGRGSDEVAADRPDLFAETPFAGLCGQCAKGRLCITYDGTAYPCIMSRSHPVGNVLEGGLAGIVEGQAVGRFRTDMNAVMRQRIETDCTPLIAGQSCAPPDPCMVCGPGVCGPDYDCMPDHPCTPEVCAPQIVIDACAPPDPCMVCGPGVCGPDHADPPPPPSPSGPGCVPLF